MVNIKQNHRKTFSHTHVYLQTSTKMQGE